MHHPPVLTSSKPNCRSSCAPLSSTNSATLFASAVGPILNISPGYSASMCHSRLRCPITAPAFSKIPRKSTGSVSRTFNKERLDAVSALTATKSSTKLTFSLSSKRCMKFSAERPKHSLSLDRCAPRTHCLKCFSSSALTCDRSLLSIRLRCSKLTLSSMTHAGFILYSVLNEVRCWTKPARQLTHWLYSCSPGSLYNNKLTFGRICSPFHSSLFFCTCNAAVAQ